MSPYLPLPVRVHTVNAISGVPEKTYFIQPLSSGMHFSLLSVPAFTVRARYAIMEDLLFPSLLYLIHLLYR